MGIVIWLLILILAISQFISEDMDVEEVIADSFMPLQYHIIPFFD